MTNKSIQRVDYPNIRAALVELHKRISKIFSDDDIKTGARHLGLLHKKTLNFNNENDVNLFWDYLIYSYRPRGFNMAEKYLRMNQNRLDDFSIAMLTHMTEACYSVFGVDEVLGNGELKVSEMFQKTSFIILDNGLCQSLKPGHCFSGHILHFDDFIVQTGAIVPVDRELLSRDEVLRIFEGFAHDPAKESFVLHPADRAKLARAILSTAIRSGYTDNVRYQ